MVRRGSSNGMDLSVAKSEVIRGHLVCTRRPTSSMQIEDIDTVGAQFCQALVETLAETIGLVLAGLVGVAFGGDLKSA